MSMPADAITAILSGTPAAAHLWTMRETTRGSAPGGADFADEVASGSGGLPLFAGGSGPGGCQPGGWGQVYGYRQNGGPQTQAPFFDGSTSAYAKLNPASPSKILGGLNFASTGGFGIIAYMGSTVGQPPAAGFPIYCESGTAATNAAGDRLVFDWSGASLRLRYRDASMGAASALAVSTGRTVIGGSSGGSQAASGPRGGQLLGVSVDSTGHVFFYCNGALSRGAATILMPAPAAWSDASVNSFIGFDPLAGAPLSFYGTLCWVALFTAGFTAAQFDAWYKALTPEPAHGNAWSTSRSGLRLPASQLWNEKLPDNAPVDPNSQKIVGQWLSVLNPYTTLSAPLSTAGLPTFNGAPYLPVNPLNSGMLRPAATPADKVTVSDAGAAHTQTWTTASVAVTASTTAASPNVTAISPAQQPGNTFTITASTGSKIPANSLLTINSDGVSGTLATAGGVLGGSAITLTLAPGLGASSIFLLSGSANPNFAYPATSTNVVGSQKQSTTLQPYVTLFDIDHTGRGPDGVRDSFLTTPEQAVFLSLVPTPDTFESSSPVPDSLGSDAIASACMPSQGLLYDVFESSTAASPRHSARHPLWNAFITKVAPAGAPGTLAAGYYYYVIAPVTAGALEGPGLRNLYGVDATSLVTVQAIPAPGPGSITLTVWTDLRGSDPPAFFNIYRRGPYASPDGAQAFLEDYGLLVQVAASAFNPIPASSTFLDDGSYGAPDTTKKPIAQLDTSAFTVLTAGTNNAGQTVLNITDHTTVTIGSGVGRVPSSLAIPTEGRPQLTVGTGGTQETVAVLSFNSPTQIQLAGPLQFTHAASETVACPGNPWGAAGFALQQDFAGRGGGGCYDWWLNAAFYPSFINNNGVLPSGVFPTGGTNNGQSASSKPTIAGVITVEDALAGLIAHPIGVALHANNSPDPGIYPEARRWPAPRHDGKWAVGNTIGGQAYGQFPTKEGMRMRLPASFDPNSLTYDSDPVAGAFQKAFVTMMRDYGWVVHDGTPGGALIYAEDAPQSGRDAWKRILNGFQGGQVGVASIFDFFFIGPNPPAAQLQVLAPFRYGTKVRADGTFHADTVVSPAPQNTVLNNVDDFTNVALGSLVSAAGIIQHDAVVTAFDPIARTITLDKPALATGTGELLTVGRRSNWTDVGVPNTPGHQPLVPY